MPLAQNRAHTRAQNRTQCSRYHQFVSDEAARPPLPLLSTLTSLSPDLTRPSPLPPAQEARLEARWEGGRREARWGEARQEVRWGEAHQEAQWEEARREAQWEEWAEAHPEAHPEAQWGGPPWGEARLEEASVVRRSSAQGLAVAAAAASALRHPGARR